MRRRRATGGLAAALACLLGPLGGGALHAGVGIQVWPDRFVYAPGGTGTVRVTLGPVLKTPVEGRLIVVERSGLNDERRLAERAVKLDPPGPDDARVKPTVIDLPYTASAVEGGREFEASFAVGNGRADISREYVLVTDQPVRMSHCITHTGFDSVVLDPAKNWDGGAPDMVRTWVRGGYAGVLEQFCFAADDFALLAPPMERWFSGQTMYPMSRLALRSMVDEAHRQGMVAMAYCTKWIYGPYGFELARQHPDWFYWDSNWYGSVWDVKTLKRWFLPWQEALAIKGQPGLMSITPLVTMPEVADYGIRQIVDSMTMFGWDGIRLDSDGWNAAVVRNPDPRNAFGRRAYPEGETDPDVLSAALVRKIRADVTKAHPGFIYGDNVGVWWGGDLTNSPRKYPAEAENGGLILEEGFNSWAHPEKGPGGKITEMKDYLCRNCRGVRRAGGYPYVIGISGGPQDSPGDARTLAACAFASGGHAYSRAADGLMDYMRFNVRHAELLYDEKLIWVDPADPPVTVAAKGPVWWREHVRARRTAGGAGQIIVHLLNAPRHELYSERAKDKVTAPTLESGEEKDAGQFLDEGAKGSSKGQSGREPANDAVSAALAGAKGQPFEADRGVPWEFSPLMATSPTSGFCPPPPIQGNIRIDLNGNLGLKVKRAIALTADASAASGELELKPSGNGVSVVLPTLSLWSIVVFEGECTPAFPPAPARFASPPRPAAPAQPKGDAAGQAARPPEKPQDTWSYWPGENLDNKFTNKNPGLVAPDVVQDRDAKSGEAVLLKSRQGFRWHIHSAPPGRYRLTCRVKIKGNEGVAGLGLAVTHVSPDWTEKQRYTDTALNIAQQDFKAPDAYQDFEADLTIKPPRHVLFFQGANSSPSSLWIERLELKLVERAPEPPPLKSWRVEATGIPDADAGDGQAASCEGAELESGILPPGRYLLLSRVKRTGRSQDNLFGDVAGYGGGFLGVQASSFTPGVYEEVARGVELIGYGPLGIRCNGMPGVVLDRLDVLQIERYSEADVLKRLGVKREPVVLATKPGLQVWLAEGLFAREAGILPALAALKADVTESCLSSFHGNYKLNGNVPTNFLSQAEEDDSAVAAIVENRGAPGPGEDEAPALMETVAEPKQSKAVRPTWEKRLMAHDVVILHDVSASVLSDLRQRAAIAAFVRAGGGLLIVGGMFGLDRGGYQDSDLLQEILPVELMESGTLHMLPQPEPIVPAAGHPFAQGLDFGVRPMVCWAHRVTPKEGATVALKAGELPVLVTWQAGKGRVAVLAAPPYGQVPAGQTGYWDWPEWPKVMQRVLSWLGEGKGQEK